MADGKRKFAYSLARELGYYNVDAMLASGGHDLLNEWIAFAELEEENEKNKPGNGTSLA